MACCGSSYLHMFQYYKLRTIGAVWGMLYADDACILYHIAIAAGACTAGTHHFLEFVFVINFLSFGRFCLISFQCSSYWSMYCRCFSDLFLTSRPLIVITGLGNRVFHYVPV